MFKHLRVGIVLFWLAFSFSIHAQTQTPASSAPVSKGRNPVIIVPGLTGSELVNSKTGEQVWFKARRAKDDDLRLPISANLGRNRDDLVPGDIIRSVQYFKMLPEVEIYERLIDVLQTRGGYKEGKWKNPPKDGHQDTYYVFAYDWRRDNVENARLLIRQMDQLRRSLRKPNLKFDVIAHSMGGLITRYAAMYGTAEPPAVNPKPSWAGAQYFDKVFLLGTPNEGSILSLNALLNGFSYIGGGLNLPFVQNIDRFDVFTIQSIFQLLPREGSFVLYDENLQPLKVDLYDPKTWEEYDWAIWEDPDFDKKMSALEKRNARAYFNAVLARAKRFQAALGAGNGDRSPVAFYLIGSDCQDTANAAVVVRDPKKNQWRTIFKPDSFTRSDGTKVEKEQLADLLTSKGDGVVTKRSLSGEGSANAFLTPVSAIFQCEAHNKLANNSVIQDQLLQILSGRTAQLN
jgi:pimeloyl-ACP methyl ester carboxylesterase